MRRSEEGRARPTRVIAIACSPRSGSTLVSEAFNATGVLGRCEEMLGPDILFHLPHEHGDWRLAARLWVSKWLHRLKVRRLRNHWLVGRSAARRYLDAYPSYVMGPERVLAVKLFAMHAGWHMVDHGLDVHHWGVPVDWIRLVRRDRLAQAVSHARASQTRQWRASQVAVAEARFDDRLLTDTLAWFGSEERMWDDHFARTGEPHLVVEYSELDHDYEHTMRRILDHVGLSHLPVPPPQVARQRDATTDEWIARYMELHPEYRDPD